MRVHVISSDRVLVQSLVAELEAGGEHKHVPRAEAEVLLIDADGCDPARSLHEVAAEALYRAIVYLARPEQVAATPDGATEIAIKPLQPGELTARLRIVQARAYGSGDKRLDLLAWAVASAGDIIEITTPEPRFEYVNPAFTRILGFSPAEIVGRTPASVMRSDMHEPGYFQKIEATLSVYLRTFPGSVLGA